MDMRKFSSASQRRKSLEEKLSVNLPHIGSFSLDEKIASVKNCENMIGAAQIPLGVAGPLKLVGDYAKGDYYIPLATTEGALVASVSRGCKAIGQNGGARVISTKIGITRAPVFVVDNLKEGRKLIHWVKSNFKVLRNITETTSSHLSLWEIKTWQLGRNVFLRFRFDTQDAMGMNMATIAVSEAVSYIEKKAGVNCVSLSGNMCVDKKPNYLNFIEGRGISVSAEVILSADVIASVLKTTTAKILETAQRKLTYGSLMSGSIGANAHFANTLAAIFIATGQDAAHVSECSAGITTVEPIDRNRLYFSVYLPDLVVGTVGGGTDLDTQKESLSILGIKGGDNGKNMQKFSEIIAAAVLAGEISLLSSLSEKSLAKAHKKLGRNGK